MVLGSDGGCNRTISEGFPCWVINPSQIRGLRENAESNDQSYVT